MSYSSNLSSCVLLTSEVGKLIKDQLRSLINLLMGIYIKKRLVLKFVLFPSWIVSDHCVPIGVTPRLDFNSAHFEQFYSYLNVPAPEQCRTFFTQNAFSLVSFSLGYICVFNNEKPNFCTAP